MRVRSIASAMRGRSRTVLLGALAAVYASQPGSLRAQTPAGPEFHVNTYTTLGQIKADVAAAANGNFVVTWESYEQDGSVWGVFAQRYDRAGNRLGAEFRVNTFTTSGQYVPHVAANARGDFVVVWTSYGQDGDGYGMFGQRYDAAGSPRGGEFQVNTFTTGFQGGRTGYGVLSTHDVSMNASGSFVVVWHGYGPTATTTYGVLARRYDRSGSPIGAEFLVNEAPAVTSVFPAAKLADDGSFVVVWNSPDGDAYGVFGRRFSATGSPVGGDFQVNQYTTAYQMFGSVDFTGTDGSFVVTWNSEGDDTSDYAVMGRRFDGGGTPAGAEFRVNTYTTGSQYGLPPKVRADKAGNFVVSWWSPQDGGSGYYGSLGVFGQRFAANGTRRGAEFQVNTYTPYFQDVPSLDVDPVGNFIVAWRSFDQEAPQTGGIFAQRFGGLFARALRVDTTGNKVLEPGETVDVRPTWRNDNGAPQTFAGVLSGITGPPGATYTILDGTGVYGVVPNATDGPCTDCYSVSVSNPSTRPAQHWDASALESILPDTQGQQKRWLLHVGDSFTDVSTTSSFYPFIETLLHFSITAGCGGTNFCPTFSTTREQMAVFVLVGKEGVGYVPPACTTPVFNDVPASSVFCRFIEELFRRGVVSGCGGGNYCPSAATTREQMAVFVLRTLDPTLNPPACVVPVFADVPPSSVFCRWIEELFRRGVVSGCGGGNYCPTEPVTREQMGVFISVTFGLTLYGP